MCGSPKAKSSGTAVVKPTEEAGNAYSGILQGAQQTAQTPYNPATAKNVAGFNPDQLAAFGNINANAGSFQPWLNQAAGYAQQGAGPITGDQISNYMNPYMQQVIDATMTNVNHQNNVQQANLLGNVAAQNALGNSRAGVAQAELGRGQNANTQQTIANLLSGGFGQALGAAQNDATRQLGASQQMGNLAGQQQQLSMNDILAQLSSGNQQQAQSQAGLDTDTANAQQQTMWPYQNNQWLAGIASGIGPLMGGTQSTNQTTSQGKGLGGILGAGLSLASMMSDRRAKEDIKEVGRTHDGQPIYKFRYKGSPKVQMGLIADQVEKSHPEAVSEGPGGFSMVNYDTATRDSEAPGFAKGGGVGFADTFFPWSDVRPANQPQFHMGSAPALQQQGFDPKKFADLGKSARTGLDSLGDSLSSAGSGKGLSGLSSLFSGFAAGGGVWGDFDPSRDLRGRQTDSTDFDIFDPMPPPLENELGDTPAPEQAAPKPDASIWSRLFGAGHDTSQKLDFDPNAMGIYGRPRVDMDPRAFGLVLPKENGLGDMPAPEQAAPKPDASMWPDLFGASRDTSGKLDFDPGGFGVYGREQPRRDVADTEAGDPFFLGSEDLTNGQDVPFRAREEVQRAGVGLSTHDFIKEEEGWHERPKWEGTQWTNGWGTRASGPDDIIDRKEADRRLQRETGDIQTWIDRNISAPMTPEQKTGLTSLAFNTGIGSLEKLKGDINAGDWGRVADRVLSFDKVRDKKTGKLEPVLGARRQREAALINQTGPLSAGDTAAPSEGRGSPSGVAVAAPRVAALTEKAKDPDAPTVGKYESKAERATGGLLKRIFGVDFNPLKLSEDERMAMLTAGLGMMSTGNVGTGGLMGMQYLTNREAATQEHDLNQQKLAMEAYKAELGVTKTAEKPTDAQKEFEQAREEGFKGSLLDFIQAKKQRENMGSLPGEQGSRIGLGNKFLAQYDTITDEVNKMTLKDDADLAIGRGKAGALWRRIETGVDALRRNLTGAGMSATEAENYVERYQMRPTDSNKTKLDKLKTLKEDLEAASSGALSGKLGIMGADYKRSLNATPELAGEAGPAKVERPAGMSDDQLYAEAGAALRSGKNRDAVRKRIEAWGLDPSRVSP